MTPSQAANFKVDWAEVLHQSQTAFAAGAGWGGQLGDERLGPLLCHPGCSSFRELGGGRRGGKIGLALMETPLGPPESNGV